MMAQGVHVLEAARMKSHVFGRMWWVLVCALIIAGSDVWRSRSRRREKARFERCSKFGGGDHGVDRRLCACRCRPTFLFVTGRVVGSNNCREGFGPVDV